ncbi:unnamed protein product [Diabrotica balteata]|uniref:Uncharacterized protein n=1 Tax=Diabrotica balteata TaxID=107213 RepID=A0A9N9XHX1_DIABA|nr:unnamed protein product [Diabrotica balteata]
MSLKNICSDQDALQRPSVSESIELLDNTEKKSDNGESSAIVKLRKQVCRFCGLLHEGRCIKLTKLFPLFRDNSTLKDISAQRISATSYFNITSNHQWDYSREVLLYVKKSEDLAEGIGNSRIQTILHNYPIYGNVAQERRGGDRISNKFNEGQQGVIKYISSLKCLESHYCRSNTRRSYLSSDLSIEKLANMYNAQANENLKVKNSYFRQIFVHMFNLGFGSPRVDVCSTCLELSEKIKQTTDPRQTASLKATQAIHKKRAKAFFALLKVQENETLTLSFDCQKNLPSPKIPDQETYYRRQLYFFNFSIVVGSSQCKMSPNNCFSYVWTEGTYPKGSNEPPKKFQFKRAAKSQHMILIQAEQFYYHFIGNFKSIMKGKENILSINPSKIAKDNTLVNKKKLSDVKRLLELHFGSDWQSNTCLKFYVHFFASCEGRSEVSAEVEEDLCGITEEAPELCV